jgi:alpha-L-fucosidase
VENHLKELINRYSLWLLWSDIGYPPGSNLPALFAYFYNHNAEGYVT